MDVIIQRPVSECRHFLETAVEAISLQLNDHTDCGVGGRQYGTSDKIKTLQV